MNNVDLTIERYIAKHQHHLLDNKDEIRNYNEMLVDAQELIETGDARFNDRIYYLQAYGSVGLLMCTSRQHPMHQEALQLFKLGKADYLVHAINDFSHVQADNYKQYKSLIVMPDDADHIKEKKVNYICQKTEIDQDILIDATIEELNKIAGIPKRICAESRLKQDALNMMREGALELSLDSRFLMKSNRMSYLSLIFEGDTPYPRMN